MAENLNIFGLNQGEIGSLNKNLVLRTQGLVYIRFGQKYVELLDRNGNLNVKIPKIFNKVNSEEEMTSDGFYILDGNLYFYFNNAILQLTGLDEGEFISYSENQDLNSILIDTALLNIGLKFKSLEEALKTIKSGYVFVEDSIYYINGSQATKLGSLNEPLNSINALDDLPNNGLNNVAILCDKGTWKFIPVVTYTEFLDYITSLLKSKEENSKEEEKVKETSSVFDPILYSTVYNVKSANFIIDLNGIVSGLQVEEAPPFDLTEGDILICSIKGSYATIGLKTNDLGETKNIIVPESSIVQKEMIIEISEYLQNGTLDSLKNTLLKEFPGCTYVQNGNYLIVTYPKEQIKYRIFTFDFIYKNNKLYFIDKEGNEIIFSTTKIEDLTLYSSLNGHDFILELDFNNSHFYVKLEANKKEKFKINYENAEIALEENLRKDGEIKIIPHTVLGDLDDKTEYYNSPSKSFRTYNEKESSQGLYSDLAVFNGAEFRGKFPEEKDFEISDFPRYSEKLEKELLDNIATYNNYKKVIPTIEFVEKCSSNATPIGAILMWSGNNVPKGYLTCDGSLFSLNDYPELYKILGYNRLPDLRDKFIVGAGNEYSLGNTGGEKSHKLTVSEMPLHKHSVDDYYYIEVSNEGSAISGIKTLDKGYFGSGDSDDDNRYLYYYTHDTKETGSNNVHENRPPYYALYFIIRAL